MIVLPNTKINLGLNILRKREDGYHDISSIFYPVKDYVDILEIVKSEKFEFTKSGIKLLGFPVFPTTVGTLIIIYFLFNVFILFSTFPLCSKKILLLKLGSEPK